jgi:putative intracellular protease/amidase
MCALQVLIPIPARDFDPSEVAVSWSVLQDRGFQVVFATPEGRLSAADQLMLDGQGLDLWGWIPGLRRVPVLGLMLRANRNAREAHARLILDPAFVHPLSYDQLSVDAFDGLILPGGHRARGMRDYLESAVLQRFVAAFFASGKPVGAICHGVVLAARSTSAGSGRSVLFGRKTTALTWALEKSAWNMSRFVGRFWDPDYYRTYREAPGASPGSSSVEAEVKGVLADPADFIDIDQTLAAKAFKGGLLRDSPSDRRAAHVVVDGNYVSARWPGDVYTFAATFAALLDRTAAKG